MIVNYVQPSMDAAIAGTYKDLKFANNTDAPIYIEGTSGCGILTFTIYGQETRSPKREVVFESEIVSETNPPVQIQGSASHSVGYVSVQQSAHVGKVAKLWKIVKEDGVEKSREARAYIQNAIASQNEGSIYAAAQTAASIAARPQQPPQEDPAEGEDPDAQNPDEENPDKKPEKEDPKKDNSNKGDSKKEDSKKEDSKKEDSKKEEPKKTDSKKEESQKEDEPVKAAEEGSINSKPDEAAPADTVN